MDIRTARLSQVGLLGLLLLAAGAQVPESSGFHQSPGLFSLPARSVHTSSESNAPDLLSGASRVKSSPRQDTLFARAAAPPAPVVPDSRELLPPGCTPDRLCAGSCANSGRAPPSR